MLATIVASLLLVVRPAPSSFLLLVAMPGAPSSVLAPSSDVLATSSLRPPLLLTEEDQDQGAQRCKGMCWHSPAFVQGGLAQVLVLSTTLIPYTWE